MAVPVMRWIGQRIAECLTESAIRGILNLPHTEPFKTVYQECDLHVNTSDPRGIIVAAVKESPVLSAAVELDAPAQYMRRPKILRWECHQYTDWVKTQGCWPTGDDPHHLIGHGLGSTGTNAGDFQVTPMCRICHRELHNNVAAWERQPAGVAVSRAGTGRRCHGRRTVKISIDMLIAISSRAKAMSTATGGSCARVDSELLE
ncbi:MULTISPECIES: DUF968 domain-containing protein [unclassified Leclercia]|uniref:DUF968 domain-containing protein n=1 Tax=unclassified Leclercia TaxID=2627398 RepID=UPI000DF4BBF8|nr:MULTISPECIES: DUF968 domain-containing protein [unclassified Leclercia]AXF64971.1 DUF968 domain-containing protein [Leclercia sp. W17]